MGLLWGLLEVTGTVEDLTEPRDVADAVLHSGPSVGGVLGQRSGSKVGPRSQARVLTGLCLRKQVELGM